MKTSLLATSFLLLSLLMVSQHRGGAAQKAADILEMGYSISITKISPESMRYAKSVGVSSIEIGFGALIEKGGDFKVSDEELQEWINKAKKATDDAGITVWSIHMPFGQYIDLSLSNEDERQRVVALHKKLLGLLEILQPKIILFHPSWYLGLNERVKRKEQLVKSATELNGVVMNMQATMAIENMLGPELLVSSNTSRESPLFPVL